MRMAVAIGDSRLDHGHRLRLGFFAVETEAAFSTEIVGGPELNEVAVVAPQNFP